MYSMHAIHIQCDTANQYAILIDLMNYTVILLLFLLYNTIQYKGTTVQLCLHVMLQGHG